MLRKILVALILTLPISAAFAQGKTPLPKDETDIESDLEEDDFTPTFDSNTSEPPAELKPAQEPAPYTGKQNQMAAPMQYRESGSTGEKIFDWSKHQNKTEVPHPHADKGLFRVTRDKTYYYKVKESDQKRATDFHIGSYYPADLKNPDAEDPRGATFEENYDQSSNPAVLLTYEWQLWRTPIGKIGARAGTGIFIAQGHGHFVGDTNAALTPREVFTFGVMPNSLGLVYRLHFWHRQLFVPYGEGGGNIWTFAEVRDDNKPPKFGGALGVYAAGGVAINLTYFDYLSRIQLDREYGINACYLTVEYRKFLELRKRYDLSADFVNAGFLMEY